MNLLRPRLDSLALCQELRLSREARVALTADRDPIGFFRRLAANERLHTDALRCLAGLLPRRVAVWWGSLCVWEMARQSPTPLVESSLEAVLRWVQRPTRQNRLAAEAPAKAGDLDTAAGCLAYAVVRSSGSMTPSHLPVIPVPRTLTAQLVGAAVVFAAVEYEPLRYADHHKLFLHLGEEVAAGKNLWPRPRSAAAVVDKPIAVTV
jgi:hypothetical protein